MCLAGDRFAFTCTNGGRSRLGQVFTYKPGPFEGTAREHEAPGELTLIAEADENSLLRNADNLVMASNADGTLADKAFPRAENGVGCNWQYSTLTGIQLFTCASSLIYFDVNADISGKTVSSATLKLYPEILPASYTTQYALWAIFDNWSEGVTWNTQPQVYAGSIRFNQPTSSLPLQIDVTTIVQNWANGTFNNFGFLLEDTKYNFPFETHLRASFFCSKEGVPGCTRPPELVITYQ